MTVAYDGYDTFDERFGHLFFAEPFSHYRLRIEYRFVGAQAPNAPGWAARNSGVIMHSQPPLSMQRDQDFPQRKDHPDVRKIMRPIVDHWASMHRVLAEGWETREGQAPSLVLGAIGVTLDFQSWRTMVRKQGMTDEQAVELMVGMVRCAAQS